MENKDRPLVTVVTVCYNAVDVLEKTILSVTNQTYSNMEYIIIDGGSKDGTVDIIKQYSDKISYWVSEPDRGIYDAMNKGIKYSKGEWINFMNAGDLFYDKNVLSNVFANLILPPINIIYGKTLAKYEWGNYIVTPPVIDVLRKRMCLCHQSIFVRGNYHKTHLYDLSIGLVADYNMLHHCYSENPKSFLYSKAIVSIYDAIDGVSAKRSVDAENEISKISGFHSLKTMIKKMINNRWLSLIVYRGYLSFHPRFKRVD